jgi:4'-phosphopantetheinyl transferase
VSPEPRSLCLGDDEVHLWLAATDSTPERARQLLSSDEWQRASRFHFESHREAFIASHALARDALGRCCESFDPAALRFTRGLDGKPQLVEPADSPLRFNLSRTAGLVACAVTRDKELGVDVEDLEAPGETEKVAESYFARSEVVALQSLPVRRRRDRFFEYWTLKESYLKARGLGLSVPLDRFAFSFDGNQPCVCSDPELGDDDSSWRFRLVRPNRRHLIAISVRWPSAEPLRLTIHQPWRGFGCQRSPWAQGSAV